MKTSDLKNMAVVSLGDGTRVGRIEDVLFDTGALHVAALVVTTAGGRSIVPVAAVRSIGSDAVTVESGAAVQASAPSSSNNLLRSLKDLSGTKVVNAEGTYLGEVQEIEIDPTSRALTGLDVRRGGVLGLGGTSVTVPAAAIRSIGPDLITAEVSAAATEGG
jgi:sporulation protein YlmC with PRC-barrel domain